MPGRDFCSNLYHLCGSNHPCVPDEVADEEGCADGDEDDGEVDLAARVGRLRARAGQAGRPDAAIARRGRKLVNCSFMFIC